MAIHSSILAREMPWTEEPGGLYSPWGGKQLHKQCATDIVHTRAPVHTHTDTHTHTQDLSASQINSLWPLLSIKEGRKLF